MNITLVFQYFIENNWGVYIYVVLVRKDMDVDEHERLSNITPTRKLK